MTVASPVPETATPAIAPAAIAGHAPISGYLFAASGAVLFSTKSIIIKLAYERGVNAETLLALRMGLSLPIYLVIGLVSFRQHVRRHLALPRLGLVFRAAWVGALGYWLASYTDFLGLRYISAHFERLILFTYPGFVVLFGWLFFGQRVRLVTLMGMAVSYAGLLLIFASGHDSTAGDDALLGAGLVLSAAIAFAAYQLLAKPAIEQMGSRQFTCVAMTGAATIAIGQMLLTQPASALLVEPIVFAYALLLAIGATVVPSFMLNAALHRISAQANAIIGTLSPVATIILAVVILRESFGWFDVAGTALVLAGVGWATLADRK
jgi:drug/metabolite transporter (DMT)-like permease